MSKKILVCDDDKGILDMVAMVLNVSGYNVIKQQHSVNVMDDVQAHKPELIILDLWMPVLSGEHLARKLKESLETKHIPVVIISASPDVKSIANKSLADDFIAKPFDIHELIKKVKKHTSAS